MSETPKTVFVTKYALTSGIVEREVIRLDDDGVVNVVNHEAIGGRALYWPRDYARTQEEARKQADGKKKKQIASLRKQIAKLEAMTFA